MKTTIKTARVWISKTQDIIQDNKLKVGRDTCPENNKCEAVESDMNTEIEF